MVATFDLRGKGASFRQENFRLLLADWQIPEDDNGVTHEFDGRLQPEPHNPHDNNAIKICAAGRTGGRWFHLCYVPKNIAALWAQKMPSAGLPTRVRIYGGFRKSAVARAHYGAEIQTPEVLKDSDFSFQAGDRTVHLQDIDVSEIFGTSSAPAPSTISKSEGQGESNSRDSGDQGTDNRGAQSRSASIGLLDDILGSE